MEGMGGESWKGWMGGMMKWVMREKDIGKGEDREVEWGMD